LQDGVFLNQYNRIKGKAYFGIAWLKLAENP